MKAGAKRSNAGANPSAIAGTRRGRSGAQPELRQYADLFELAPIAYLSVGADQIIRQANFAAAELLGAERERLPGAHFGSFAAEDSRAGLAEFLAQVRTGGMTRSCELELVSGSRPPAAVMLTAKPDRGQDACLVTITDIGARRLAAESKLQGVKDRFRALHSMSHNFFWGTDAEHRITKMSLISRTTGKLFLQHGPTAGMRRWDAPYLSPDEAGWAAHRAMLEARLPFRNFELSRLGLDGSEHFFSISGDPVFDASGTFVGYHGLGRDITERKVAEKTLRESEERYRRLFENAGDGIMILSRDGKMVAANETFARMHGYTVPEILSMSLQDLVTPEAFRLAPQRWDRVYSGELKSIEVEHRHKNGHVFTVEISASIITSAADTQMQFFYRDITERKRTDAALLAAIRAQENANRAKTRFLAAASHDLRQPVQAINLFLDALAQTGLSEEQKEISGYLGLSVRSLRELLNTLLDISQLDAGAVKPEAKLISVDDLFRDLQAEFGHLADEKRLSLRYFARPGLLLLTDPRLLKRALRNIIGNAIKYTHQGGILIGARRRGAHALVQVWDTGIGIAPEHVGQIFEEYFQIANHARDRTKGNGLGLAIVERLVRLIDSEIHCNSRPGRGSVFGLMLPLARNQETTARKGMPQAIVGLEALALSRFSGSRVVVVEDDPLVSKGIEHALSAFGATVASFDNAEDALADFETAAADLYISDFRLAGRLNGIQLLDALQQLSVEPINGVLITGENPSSRIELSASCNWKVLFKPIDLRALLSAL